ncbi:Hypp9039 [Branchiostoma lanceolatum]|uniref:Hypp9039 protein n=1 Tax=Branchiostoma lanceolatum TaxID=7740 RepID=A0A8K0EK69_BRALA|nr:Hypp9039 [Branchiostoma lanceolatum]
MPSARESFIQAIEICFTVVSLVGLVILVTGMVMLFLQYEVEKGVGLTVTLVGLGCVSPAFAYLTIGICVVGCNEEPESPLFGTESTRRRGAIRRRHGEEEEDAAPVVNPSFICEQTGATGAQPSTEISVASAVLSFSEDVLRLESLEVEEEGYVLEVVTVQTEYVGIAEDVENVTMTTDEGKNEKMGNNDDDVTKTNAAMEDVTEDVVTEDKSKSKEKATHENLEVKATAATIVVKPRDEVVMEKEM